MKKFELKQIARNDSEAWGCAKLTADWLSGTKTQNEEFVSSLGEEWERIPPELVGSTTEQNFISYARALKEE